MTNVLYNTKSFARGREVSISLYEYYARTNGLQSKSMLILMWIYYNKNGITQQTISKKTLSTKQVVSATIKTFLDKGYIYFEKDNKDRRIKKIKLTDEGRQYASSILDPLEQIEVEAMKALTPQQQQQLIEWLSIFNSRLNYGIEQLIENRKEIK